MSTVSEALPLKSTISTSVISQKKPSRSATEKSCLSLSARRVVVLHLPGRHRHAAVGMGTNDEAPLGLENAGPTRVAQRAAIGMAKFMGMNHTFDHLGARLDNAPVSEEVGQKSRSCIHFACRRSVRCHPGKRTLHAQSTSQRVNVPRGVAAVNLMHRFMFYTCAQKWPHS